MYFDGIMILLSHDLSSATNRQRIESVQFVRM